MFIEWVLLGKVLKLYLVHKSKNRDFHNTSLQNALTRNLGQRLNTHLVSQGHILGIITWVKKSQTIFTGFVVCLLMSITIDE